MNKVICVYSSSSNSLQECYFKLAEDLGKQIALSEDSLLYGAGMTGLMGACAREVHKNGGKVIGVIPKALNVEGIVYQQCDELIETIGMRERKALMDEKSDAFIALPGGYGTLEELLEIITLKQLRYHNKPIVIINGNQFYSDLLQQFDKIIKESFAKEVCAELYFVTTDIREALNYINKYTPKNYLERWMTDVVPKT